MAVELGVAHDQIMPLRAGSGLELPTENPEAPHLVGLMILAALAAFTGVGQNRGRWPSRVVFVSGVGSVMLALLVQQAPATQALLSSSQIQSGSVAALTKGLIIAVVGASCCRTPISRS